MTERVYVTRCSAVDEPRNSLQSNSHIDDFHREILKGCIVVILILHKNHISNLESANEILHRRSEVTSAGPHILNEGDFGGIDAQLLSEPSKVELYALFFEEFVIVRFVENLDAQHDEPGVVATRQTDVVEVVEPQTKLRTDQWVCWRLQFTCYTIRLETEYPRSNVIDIVSPPSNNGVAVDGSAWNSSRRQRFFETRPRFLICDFLTLSTNSDSFANECIFANASEITFMILFIAAQHCAFLFSPKIVTTFALCSFETYFFEDFSGVILFRVLLKHRFQNFLHFLRFKCFTFADTQLTVFSFGSSSYASLTYVCIFFIKPNFIFTNQHLLNRNKRG
jgi:hypothetical protein